MLTAFENELTNLITFDASMDENEHSIIKKQRRMRAKPEYTTSQPPEECSSLSCDIVFLRFLLIFFSK
jgi:hypothetical protein